MHQNAKIRQNLSIHGEKESSPREKFAPISGICCEGGGGVVVRVDRGKYARY